MALTGSIVKMGSHKHSLWILVILLHCIPLHGIDRDRKLEQLYHRAWALKDGASELWIVFSDGGDPSMPIVLATLGATLAMIGPGAWSIDAHLFGGKHFEIPER
jgi:hypothetical protein